MANISVSNSTYTSGGIDTRDTLDGTSDATFQQMNGSASASVAIETILGDGPTLKGNKADLASRLAEAIDADGKVVGHSIDGRTNTAADAAKFFAETTGTPAVGIGTAILLQAESQDESPSDILRVGGTFDSVTAGNEFSSFQVFLRTAGAALSAAWAFARGTGGFGGIFTHSNTATRLYTLQDSSDTLVGRATTDTLTNKTISSGGQVKSGGIATATGSVSGDLGFGASVNIAMNDYAFSPNIQNTGVGSGGGGGVSELAVRAYFAADSSTTVGRFRLFNTDVTGSQLYTVRWRYITASDNPTIWVVYETVTSMIHAVWVADDPLSDGSPGVSAVGHTSLQLTSRDLESFSILSTKASEARDVIREKKLRQEHQAYRALQLVANDEAPSQWLLTNCQINPVTKRLEYVAGRTNPSTH